MSCAVFTNYFGIQNAKSFEQFISGNNGYCYLSIGHILDWPNEPHPSIPKDTANTFYDLWNNSTAFKRITAADMNLVIPRVDWTSGNEYVAYHHDVEMHKKTDPDQIYFDNPFYVRNSKDQVFKCLANNTTANTETAVSTIEPEISIGGQLPENPYIELADGYKWKYMYTIPSGLKEKFFTKQYMPVVSYDPAVKAGAVDGRLDVFKILVKGDGYNNNVTATNVTTANVIGNGTGANVTIDVTAIAAGGANVTEVNVITAGSGYTRAEIEITDPSRTSSNDAVIQAIIGPPGGHGYNVERELGASNLMISVNIDGNEDGYFPLGVSEVHGFRQIGMILNPTISSTGAVATESKYRGTNKYILTNDISGFSHDELVYQGNVNSPSFSGIVEHYDPTGVLYLTDVRGTFNPANVIVGESSQGSARVVSVDACKLKKYSGKLLYIENTAEIIRSLDQIVQFKFTLRF